MQSFNVYMVGVRGRVVRTWAFCTAQAGTELMILLPSHWWEYRFVLPHLAQKYVRVVAEEKAQQAAAALAEDLYQRTQWRLLTSSGAPGLHVLHTCKCGENTHKIYLKNYTNVFDPPDIRKGRMDGLGL